VVRERMPTFRYTAKRGPSEIVEGIIEAENRSGVLTYLADLGYVPVRINEQAAAKTHPARRQLPAVQPSGVPVSHLTAFTRQFASLVRSQVPLLRTLQILEEQVRHPYFRQVLRGAAEEVRQGQVLSSALGKYPKVFSLLYTSLVYSGEVSGALDVVLERLAEQAEREETLRTTVRTAFTYPVFVGVVGLFTVVFLITFVMPRLSTLLVGLGEHLPMPTRLLLALAAWMSSGWFWVGLLTSGVVLALLWRGRGRRGRLAVDRLILRLPVIGTLVQEIEIARFARSFGLLINHGISVLRAMEVSIPVVKHLVIRSELERVPEGLRQGSVLSACLTPLSVSTPFLINTVAVGEESGKLGEALTEVASYYEREAERRLQTMATLLEPTLIVVIGLIVGFIVIAVLLPIFEMSSITR
jgi:type II secretory pathway component PulF